MSATNSQRTDRMYLFDIMIRSASLESKLLIVAKAHLGEFEDVFTDNRIEGATRIVLATNDDQSVGVSFFCETLLLKSCRKSCWSITGTGTGAGAGTGTGTVLY